MKAAIVVDSRKLVVETDTGLIISIRGLDRDAMEFLADRLNDYDKGNIAIAALQRIRDEQIANKNYNQSYITASEALKDMGLV